MLPLRGKWSESLTWHRPYSAVYLHRLPTLLVREINNPRSFIGGLQIDSHRESRHQPGAIQYALQIRQTGKVAQQTR